MAKRKRLSAPQIGPDAPPGSAPEPAPETKGFLLGRTQPLPRRAPIAQVAGDAAGQAAAERLAGELAAARGEGRLVQALPLAQVEAGHILRDRTVFDAEEMAALKASIAARGQQVPVEVVETGPGAYGLISGLRRLTVLHTLFEETGEARFGVVKALIKPIESAPQAYIAMVEENEIRADLSFYERGRLAFEAAERGVFDSPQAAIRALYAHAPPARRSKIAAFVALHESFGDCLRFPEAIPEKLGLALVKAQGADAGFADALRARLAAEPPGSAAAERRLLEAALRKPAAPKAAPESAPEIGPEIVPGVVLEEARGTLILRGPGVTGDLAAALRAWLATRG